MSIPKLTKKDKSNLDKIQDVFNYVFQIDLKIHFAEAGKAQELADAGTVEEKAEQKKCLQAVMAEKDDEYNGLKMTDIFVRAARRIAKDEDILAFTSEGKLTEKDVKLLDKCKFDSLSSLVKQKI